MKIVFVNAFKTKNPFNWITAIWTKGKYSHCELYFDFEDNRIFGASFTDAKCRWDEFEPHKEYEVYTLKTSIKQERAIKAHCVKLVEKKYDYLGLFGFVFNSDDFEDKEKFFCSELITLLLEEHTEFIASKEACRVSPNRLFKDLKNYIKK